jgi:F-type H+-transporting ATPase subunit b
VNINLTLIGQSISFLFFVWFCHAFVWGYIRKAMDEREKQIADGLDAADRAGRDLELAQDKATKQLREAKAEAATIIEAANKRVEEAKDVARTEGDRLKAAAEAQIEQDVNRAKEQLRSQVAKLALVGAEKVLEASIDESVHKDMVDKLAASL